MYVNIYVDVEAAQPTAESRWLDGSVRNRVQKSESFRWNSLRARNMLRTLVYDGMFFIFKRRHYESRRNIRDEA